MTGELSGENDRRRPTVHKGRGAAESPQPRFIAETREDFDDGWGDEAAPPPLATIVTEERARGVISRNTSPDLPFTQSLNPYRGCEHGCVYCYARPSHAYLDLSPGLDFESRLFAKVNVAEVLRRELSAPGYRCSPISIGANTDAYQPVERRLQLTRQVLEVMVETRHPCTLITKGALIERDIDLLATLAKDNLVEACVSITTLDTALARRMEPRATSPARRLETIRRLAAANVPVGVMFAPVIAGLNAEEMEAVLAAAAEAGADTAGYVVLRLAREIGPMFRSWLDAHYPLRAARVMSLMQAQRGGRDYDASFDQRMKGTGPLAALTAQRFARACRANGLDTRHRKLETARFLPPSRDGQLALFPAASD